MKKRRTGLLVGALLGVSVALASGPSPADDGREPPLDPAASARELELLKRLDADEFLTARREAEKLLEEEPGSIIGHYVLGRVLHTAEGSLPQAMRELARARELYEQRHPLGNEAPNWRLHQQILYSTSWLALEMEEFEFQLQILDFHDELYNPRAAGEHAWPLLKLGRFDKAREFANLALGSKQAWQRSLGFNARCAIEGEAGEREPYYLACVAALENKRAEAKKPGASTPTLAIDAYNAALAALADFKPDEAEKLALEGTRHFAPTSANPWRLLVDLRLAGGRAGDALEAVREMQSWRKRIPANVRGQERAATDAVAARVFLLAGEADRGMALADALLEQPDRRGLTTSTPEQALGGHALLRRALRRAAAERSAERDAATGGGASRLARLQHAVEDWFAERSDEERARKVLTDRKLLLATLRPHLSRGLDDVPPWLVGELVPVLGPGVFAAALDEARALDTTPTAAAYFDAYEAEAALHQGDEDRAVALARRALAALPASEALLKARTAAVAWRALDDASADAFGFLEQALTLDGSVFQRLGHAFPAHLELPGDEVGSALGELLEKSPRLDVGNVGVTIKVETRGADQWICALGPASGAQIRCGKARPEDVAHLKDVDPPAVLEAKALAAALHRDVLAVPLGLSGTDVSSLDGSTVVGEEAVREKLEKLLQDDGPIEPSPN